MPPNLVAAPTNDVVDLAMAIAGSAAADPQPPPQPTNGAGPAPTRANDRGQALRNVPTTSDVPAPGRSSGPVTFRPLVDPLANRSVVVASLGLVLCFFPLLALAGLLMGLISIRRIKSSGGSLIGERTARFGIMLGAAGTAIGVAFVIWMLATQ